MAATALLQVASHMQVLRLHCTFEILQNGELPLFKGSTLHGWLGQQLLKQDPQLYNLMYAEHEQQQLKPYALACNDQRTAVVEQATLSFELALFGSATQIAGRLLEAMSSHPLGLGPTRIPIRLHSLASRTPQGLRIGIHPMPLLDWLVTIPANVQHEVVLQLKTPLRIKHKGKILRQGVPPLSLVLAQVQRRLMLLVRSWVNADPALSRLLTTAVPLGEHEALHSPVYFEDWQRYSNRQSKHLPFGGLQGELSYRGDIFHALAWLQAGQLMQIGGKTSFGLGYYQLLY
ncbi:CRISPR system precrRNA processing endoribonuclease RAMP protein Cas6 [Pseudomonas sp. F1_0610]|uniref:CRISPR system precrRNA processing endoribonuclease RAMP protein Cas6 n=1 Tax=Pseudomonas sp. F1_0610 TaxID=3114284 RepID=UPI0039C2F25C